MSKKQHVTAIIYDRKGNVLSIGQNSYVKTHPLQARYANQVNEPKKVFLHAEIHAITKCRDLNQAYKISIFRYHEDGTPAMAKPCKVCQAALSKTKIRIVEHT